MGRVLFLWELFGNQKGTGIGLDGRSRGKDFCPVWGFGGFIVVNRR
jgi:hypothetical protein